MIVKRKDTMTLFTDMAPHTVFGYDGTYCVKLVTPINVRDSDSMLRTYHAFDLQQSTLRVMPNGAKGFIIKGSFVEGA